ncbi:DUF7669 domain-containing protein [Lentibacillus jeotgali]|uniref:DUF7669 domain-containing protein n=1 Tax=Lentibacillus jeotgali TaxID=558169 RepID=UPI0002628015|nr:hypothetical protein [Lentibacillus jeotgali]
MDHKQRTSCRDEMLQVIKHLVKQKGENQFSIQEVLDRMERAGTTYKESTIRTHLTSKCCVNAKHRAIYNDNKRIDHGLYALTDSANTM